MPFRLTKHICFPDPQAADDDGLLAYGGDLSPRRVLFAYANGIFPWPQGDEMPLLWFSPNPRTVLIPEMIHVSRSMKKVLKRRTFEITLDLDFEKVIWSCATIKRKHEKRTWIIPGMVEAYIELHKAGFAHSCEAWSGGEMAGGVYGVSLGAAFFGESMFTTQDNASKVALIVLLEQLRQWNFHFVDCQMRTDLVAHFGAVDWSREKFLNALGKALVLPTRRGRWKLDEKILERSR